MGEAWDMSFLIDQATKIHEARGNFGKHLGTPMRGLVGEHLINFVAEEDRLLFLRFMAKLLLQSGVTTAAARIRTPVIGEKIFELDARTSPRPKSWWLMLSASASRGYAHLGDIVSGDPLATGDEFGQLARSAAKQAGGKLDMTLFQSRAVAERSFGKMTPEKRAELDKRIGEVLVGSTPSGIVTKPEAGQYAVLHSAEITTQSITDQIVAAASEMDVSAEDLGLSHTTAKLEADIQAEDVARLIKDMREKINQRTGDPEPIGEVVWGEVKKPSLMQKMMGKVKK